MWNPLVCFSLFPSCPPLDELDLAIRWERFLLISCLQTWAHSSWPFSSGCALFFNSELLHFIFPLSVLSILMSPRQPCTPRDSFQKLEISPEKVPRTCVWEVEPTIVLFLILFSFVCSFIIDVQSLIRVWILVTPWTAALQASLSFTVSWNLLRFMSRELDMLSN